MSSGVDERVAKGNGQSHEGQDRDEDDDEDCGASTVEFPSLQNIDQWIQDQRDKATDQHQEKYVAQAIENLSQDVDESHDEDGGEDRPQGDVVVVGPLEKS